MPFTGFTARDFDVFNVPGLEPRMEALISRVRPKLEALGADLAPYLTALCGEEMFVHVAKHARRKVNPPIDTWVAWAANKRGYKAIPHFEVGMFGSHLFIIFAVIYESPNKIIFAEHMLANPQKIRKAVPDQYYWSMDHMNPEGTPHSELGKEDIVQMAEKLKKIKKAEIMCGLKIDKNDPVLQDGQKLESIIQSTFDTLLPLYKKSF